MCCNYCGCEVNFKEIVEDGKNGCESICKATCTDSADNCSNDCIHHFILEEKVIEKCVNYLIKSYTLVSGFIILNLGECTLEEFYFFKHGKKIGNDSKDSLVKLLDSTSYLT